MSVKFFSYLSLPVCLNSCQLQNFTGWTFSDPKRIHISFIPNACGGFVIFSIKAVIIKTNIHVSFVVQFLICVIFPLLDKLFCDKKFVSEFVCNNKFVFILKRWIYNLTSYDVDIVSYQTFQEYFVHISL